MVEVFSQVAAVGEQGARGAAWVFTAPELGRGEVGGSYRGAVGEERSDVRGSLAG